MLVHSRKLAVASEILINEEDKPLVESLLQAITEGATPKLKVLLITLRVNNGPLDLAVDIDSGLLSRAVVKVNFICWIQGGHRTQMEAVFTAIIQSQDLALKTLVRTSLPYTSAIQEVSPDVMAAAVVKLKGFVQDRSTEDQVVEVLTRLGTTPDSKLRDLKLNFLQPNFSTGPEFNISQISPEILTKALLSIDLDYLGLDNFKFSAEQLIQLLAKIRDSELKLTHLCLEGDNSLSQVPPQLVASAFSRLESVVLNSAESVDLISAEQLSAIFTMLLSQELAGSKLKSLDILFIEEELSTISPDVLVEGIRRLETFELHYSTVTAEQINAILSAVTEGRQGMLKTIKIVISNEDILGTVSQTLLESAQQMKDLLEIELND